MSGELVAADKKWIGKQDIIAGIVRLMKNGKKLPNADLIAAVRMQFPSGTPEDVIRQAERKEMERQIIQLADEWFEIVVIPERYRTKDEPVMNRERWDLGIKEALKIKDYRKVLDVSIVCDGISNADLIIKRAREAAVREAQEKANAEWRTFGDTMQDDDQYRNSILAHWTAVRIKKGCWAFNYPSYLSEKLSEGQREANRAMLINEGQRAFPNVPQPVLLKNLILIGMQHVNICYCQKECPGFRACYMKGHQLGLTYDAAAEKFFVTSSPEICPKYLETQAIARAEAQARRAKIAQLSTQQLSAPASDIGRAS